MVVRANAMILMNQKNNQVDDPLFYQKFFFDPLSKAMFLQALQVNDPVDPPQPGPGQSAPAINTQAGSTNSAPLAQGN